MSYRADKLVIDTHTHTHTRTHRPTDAGDDNTRRPKLASGNNAKKITEAKIRSSLWKFHASLRIYFSALFPPWDRGCSTGKMVNMVYYWLVYVAIPPEMSESFGWDITTKKQQIVTLVASIYPYNYLVCPHLFRSPMLPLISECWIRTTKLQFCIEWIKKTCHRFDFFSIWVFLVQLLNGTHMHLLKEIIWHF